MLYRHSWACLPSAAEYRRHWPQLLHDTRSIIGHVRAAGVVIAGTNGLRRPVVNAHGIAFNGDATSDLDGQPFTLLAPIDAPGVLTVTASCTTGRKPYDAAVAAVLLRCALLMPGAFAVASTGRWDQQWARGAMLERLDEPGYQLAARTVIAELFGDHPAANPLYGSLADIQFPLTVPGPSRNGSR
ncbi:hypothetical protein OWR29_38995 [Actinoplanes sp. Pm04-4]|uniref:Uncharacterized protein n=1 Tax=Paractinoplanes pyxinae TaxID=2997416 RepID=A0ABT4BBX2_9ACTN|nr:hypothetical protein [Actinoplanes pyxinae]MCY1144018.1 hypothetical protein [Actinoplanes pyxinae]